MTENTIEIPKLAEKEEGKDYSWYYENSKWFDTNFVEIVIDYLFHGISYADLDYKYFHVNKDFSKGRYTNQMLKAYLRITGDFNGIFENFSLEDAINELKLLDDDDYKQLIEILEKYLYSLNAYNNFLKMVYVDQNEIDILKYLIESNKNLIIQGPPGVGKNFVAKNLADSIVSERDSEFVKIIRFHENYSYDYFVESPSNQGEKGIFYNFCQKAMENPNYSFFFIIDDIDKGNISQIFGELFSLIDKDKRGEKYKIPLFYSQESFFVPENVHIIGLLNASNRSSITTDYAFRRKFSFFDLKPGFNSKNFENYMDLEFFKNTHFKKVINKIKELNSYIEKDDSLGSGFCIGHSYFCNLEHNVDVNQQLKSIIQFKIIPLLREYWFDEPEKVQYWETELFSSLGITI